MSRPVDVSQPKGVNDEYVQQGVSENWNKELKVDLCDGRSVPRSSVGDVQGTFGPDWNLRWLIIPPRAITDQGIHKLEPYRETLLYLDVSDASITDDAVEFLKSFSSLRGLSLRRTKITSQALNSFRDFPSLVMLNLSGTQVKGKDIIRLCECPKLTRLILNDLPITDEDVTRLMDLPLTELGLERTRLSSKKIEEFRTTKPNCLIHY